MKLLAVFFVEIPLDLSTSTRIRVVTLQRMSSLAIRASDYIPFVRVFVKAFSFNLRGLSQSAGVAVLQPPAITPILMWRHVLWYAITQDASLIGVSFDTPIRYLRPIPGMERAAWHQYCAQRSDYVLYALPTPFAVVSAPFSLKAPSELSITALVRVDTLQRRRPSLAIRAADSRRSCVFYHIRDLQLPWLIHKSAEVAILQRLNLLMRRHMLWHAFLVPDASFFCVSIDALIRYLARSLTWPRRAPTSVRPQRRPRRLFC